jgi:transcriptional regulator with XRE-family HTH domain
MPPERTSSAERKAIAEHLKALREAAGLKQDELAAKVGVKRNTVSRTENGHTMPQASHLRAWADALGVTVDALLTAPTVGTEDPAVNGSTESAAGAVQ